MSDTSQVKQSMTTSMEQSPPRQRVPDVVERNGNFMGFTSQPGNGDRECIELGDNIKGIELKGVLSHKYTRYNNNPNRVILVFNSGRGLQIFPDNVEFKDFLERHGFPDPRTSREECMDNLIRATRPGMVRLDRGIFVHFINSRGGGSKKRHSRKRHSRKRHSRKRHSKKRHSKKRHSRKRHSKKRHSKKRHSRKRHSRKRHSRKRHSRKRHSRRRNNKGKSKLKELENKIEESLMTRHPLILPLVSSTSDREGEVQSGRPASDYEIGQIMEDIDALERTEGIENQSSSSSSEKKRPSAGSSANNKAEGYVSHDVPTYVSENAFKEAVKIMESGSPLKASKSEGYVSHDGPTYVSKDAFKEAVKIAQSGMSWNTLE